MNLNKQNLINKIIYRAQYRGTKEMEIFVTSFVKSIIDTLNIDELNELIDIINLDDENLLKLSNNKNHDSLFTNNKISKKLIDFKKKY